MTLLKKPKREDFTLHHSDYPLFKDDEFTSAELDYYKAVAEFAVGALNGINRAATIKYARMISHDTLEAIHQTEQPT